MRIQILILGLKGQGATLREGQQNKMSGTGYLNQQFSC